METKQIKSPSPLPYEMKYYNRPKPEINNNMKPKDIKQFLSKRPAISVTMLCKEAGITKRYLDYILDENDSRSLTEETAKKLKPIMEKYGF